MRSFRSPLFMMFLLAFGPPAVAADAPPKPRAVTTVPFTPVAKHGGPLVRLGLNRAAEGRFLFDTGCNVCIITDTLAAKLGLTPTPARGPDGKPFLVNGLPSEMVVLPEVQVGGFAIAGVPFVVLKEKELASALAEPIDGVIGGSFFAQFATLFDFQKREIRLWHGGGLTQDELKGQGMEGAVAVPLANFRNDLLYTVRVRINRKAEEDLVIDTGADRTFLSPRAARRLELGPVVPVEDASTVFGKVAIDTAPVSTLSVGSLAVEDLPVGFARRDGDDLWPRIGLDVLARHRVVMDVPKRKLFLKPAP